MAIVLPLFALCMVGDGREGREWESGLVGLRDIPEYKLAESPGPLGTLFSRSS